MIENSKFLSDCSFGSRQARCTDQACNEPASFERLWRAEEIEAAKEPVRERVHLATGLLLPVWKRLPDDHVRVTRIVSADGTSIIEPVEDGGDASSKPAIYSQRLLDDALGALLEIEMAHWWRPTAANFFDRVPKARILEAFDAVGGPELVSRYADSKKADLASAAERIFSGEFIGEKDVKEQALAWLPAVMRFGILKEEAASDEETSAGSEDAGNELTEQAA